MAQAAKKTTAKKKQKKSVPVGKVYVQATFNNTIITFTDPKGNVIASSSAGASGFKGSRKGTAYAAQLASENAVEKARTFGIKQVSAVVRGIGQGREAAIRALANTDIVVTGIKDATGVPHNGCRPRKARRV